MLRLEVQFLAGRFHATPWDFHVNEGSIEWPPSPARLVRALLAASFRDATVPNEPPAAAEALLERLSSALPTYWAPPARTAHLRHYMPVGQKTTKVVDSFLRFADSTNEDGRVLGGRGSLLIEWPVSLDDGELSLLKRLAARVGYLGRAESWCDWRIVDSEFEPGSRVRVAPAGDSAPTTRTLRLLSPVAPGKWAQWRDSTRDQSVAFQASQRDGALTKSQEKKARGQVPERWIDALCMQTDVVHKHGWSEPPGLEWAVYEADAPLIDTRSRLPSRGLRARERRPEFAVLTLASTAQNREVLPRLTRCAPQGGVLHRALAARLAGRQSVVLLGARAKEPIPTNHRHAHLLPLDDIRGQKLAGAVRAPGQIRHFLLWADLGFDNDALAELRSLKRLDRESSDGGSSVAEEALFVTMTLQGGAAELRRFGLDGKQLRNLLGPSRDFESVTPYVPARHLKPRYALVDDVRREIGHRASILAPGLEGAALEEWLGAIQVEELDREVALRKRLREFSTRRSERSPRPPTGRFFGIRIRFPAEIRGPVALGYGSHWGLGLFEAV